MSRGVVAYIDREALQHNFLQIKQRVPQAAILAMIKSNAYGHGLLRVAKHLDDADVRVDALGVACLEEALMLRAAHIELPIVVMSGFGDPEELRSFAKYQLGAVVHSMEQIHWLEENPVSIAVWLKIDSGMHRLGFRLDEAVFVYRRLEAVRSLQKPIHLMTHLASADISPAYTQQQITQFLAVTATCSAPKSILNSAGILGFPSASCDWVRPGGLLYGVSPFAHRTGEQEGLKPVMTLEAKLLAVKIIPKGAAVGYCGSWQSEEAMPIGIVGVGYGDGYPRHARSGTPVLIDQTYCPVIGRVSMDMMCVDLRKRPETQPGDRVTLWGRGLPVETIAQAADTIGYALLCGVTSRVRFLNA